jgi:hypothetical protein
MLKYTYIMVSTGVTVKSVGNRMKTLELDPTLHAA